MSHSVDGLIGTTTHHNPHLQQKPMYGTPQYLSVYGGPPYQQPYFFSLPPSISIPPPLTLLACPPSQPSSGTPSTFSYTPSTSESAMPSYVLYGSLPKNNLYFPFPGPPQPMSPPLEHPHIGVNFFQPSLVQQYQNFEQLNMENMTHQSNNSKNKGKK
jgi:hypothetical protein